MLGFTDSGKLTINADGTGEMTLGEQPGSFKWTASGDDTIVLTPIVDGAESDATVTVTSKDDALFMDMEQDGQSATIIFTHDGTYEGAKLINMAEATPITSEAELIGTWKLVGMDMMGISIYGDADSLGNMMGAEADATITFEEGGVATSSTGTDSWAVSADGATYTTKGLSGEVVCPVMKLGDEIAIDASETMGGMEFIMVLAK